MKNLTDIRDVAVISGNRVVEIEGATNFHFLFFRFIHRYPLMKPQDISIIDLTSAILGVRSFFAKRGFNVKVTKKKAMNHFTTGQIFPILVRDTKAGRKAVSSKPMKIE